MHSILVVCAICTHLLLAFRRLPFTRIERVNLISARRVFLLDHHFNMGREKVSSNDVHRLFLQAVLSRRIMPEKVARTLWVKCKEAVASVGDVQIDPSNTDEGWNAFLDKVHQALNPLDLEFRSVLDDNSNTKLFALVNRKGDEVAQLASDYTPAEITFFKAVVEQIILSPKYVYSISSLGALRETASLKQVNVTKAHAETLLASFVARGWLAKSARARYSLAARSLLELGSYLEKYGDECVDCTICHDKVYKGIMCATPNCKTFLHKSCADTMRRRRNACPTCQAAWGDGGAGVKPLGEAAYNGQKEVRRTLAGGDEDDGDEGDEEMDGTQDMSQTLPDSEPSQTQGRSQSKRGKGRQSQGDKKGKKVGGRLRKRQETPLDEEEEETQETEKENEDEDEDGMDVDQKPKPKSRRSTRKV